MKLDQMKNKLEIILIKKKIFPVEVVDKGNFCLCQLFKANVYFLNYCLK